MGGEPEAEAEAAADAWYGYYGYGRPYGYKTKWVDGYGYANYGHYVGKREAEADPGFVYTVGYPHAYGLPLVYTHPVAYANNVCTNEGGAVVPCAAGVAPGSGVYNFADAPVGIHTTDVPAIMVMGTAMPTGAIMGAMLATMGAMEAMAMEAMVVITVLDTDTMVESDAAMGTVALCLALLENRLI